MSKYMIATFNGPGKWVPEAFVSTARTYADAWHTLSAYEDRRLLPFVKVTAIGGVWQENEDDQPMTQVEAWTMMPNDDHYRLLRQGRKP